MVSYYSYWSGVMSRASDSKLRNTPGWQIHGGRCCAVFVWAGLFSSGKRTIFCKYTVQTRRLRATTATSCPTHATHKHRRLGLLASVGVTSLNHLRLICMSDPMLFNISTNHASSFIYLVNSSGFSAKHTALLGFVQLLNNVLRCCDQSNRNAADSNSGLLFFSMRFTYSTAILTVELVSVGVIYRFRG